MDFMKRFVGIFSLFATALALHAAGPWDAAWSPDGTVLAVSDRGEKALWLVTEKGEPESVPLRGPAMGVAWNGNQILVSEYDCGTVAVVNAKTRSVVNRLNAGPKPMGLAVAGDVLLVTEYGLSQLIGIDLKSGERRFTLPVSRHPADVVAARDGSVALTGGLLPGGKSGPAMAAEVILLNPQNGNVLATLPLPDGSSNLRGFAISPDGSMGLAVHTRGRTAVPSTQIDRGWINVNMITLIDLKQRKLIASCILDAPYKGAADPWGVDFAGDGSVWITLSGTGELMHFDLPRFMRLLNGAETLPPEPDHRQYADRGTLTTSRTAPQRWAAIAANPELRTEFANNLAMLSGIGLTQRFCPDIQGLRALAVHPDGRRMALLGYFDRTLSIADAENGYVLTRQPLGTRPLDTPAARGERLFFDGQVSFQGWMSCATCHHEARTDGLNWDLMNSGLGFPENTKSMLDAYRTPPMTWTGVRPDYRTSIAKGFFFMMYVPSGNEVADVAAYFESLKPEVSPYLERQPDGTYNLTPTARRGKAVFEKALCSTCHSGELYTDLRPYDVGTGGTFDTPGLVEIWRTAPYLHDGSAGTLAEIWGAEANDNRHGLVSELDESERQALIAYLLSL
jgi:WD40 repeat protein